MNFKVNLFNSLENIKNNLAKFQKQEDDQRSQGNLFDKKSDVTVQNKENKGSSISELAKQLEEMKREARVLGTKLEKSDIQAKINQIKEEKNKLKNKYVDSNPSTPTPPAEEQPTQPVAEQPQPVAAQPTPEVPLPVIGDLTTPVNTIITPGGPVAEQPQPVAEEPIQPADPVTTPATTDPLKYNNQYMDGLAAYAERKEITGTIIYNGVEGGHYIFQGDDGKRYNLYNVDQGSLASLENQRIKISANTISTELNNIYMDTSENLIVNNAALADTAQPVTPPAEEPTPVLQQPPQSYGPVDLVVSYEPTTVEQLIESLTGTLNAIMTWEDGEKKTTAEKRVQEAIDSLKSAQTENPLATDEQMKMALDLQFGELFYGNKTEQPAQPVEEQPVDPVTAIPIQQVATETVQQELDKLQVGSSLSLDA